MSDEHLCIDLFAAVANAPRDPDLEARMLAHIQSDPNSEALDDKAFASTFGGAKKSDFLVGGRAGVIELKTFNGDPTNRIEATMNARMKEPGAPIVFGSVGMNAVLDGMDDGEALSRKIIDLSTRAARRHLKYANEQIASTKSHLGIDSGAGTLILLNDSQPLIDIGAITYSIKELMERDLRAFDQLDFILICVESHLIRVQGETLGYPLVGIFRSTISNAYLDLMGRMAGSWCARHGSPPIRIQHRGDWKAMAPVYPDGAPILNFYKGASSEPV